MLKRSKVRAGIGATASWTVLGIAIACSGQLLAQTSPQTEPQTTTSGGQAAEPPIGNDVVVVGARESQQSANRRKRNAATATDSIVADDVGSFPDRNVNEAISRVPGVALGRNEFGEGDSIAIRGNGPDLTRVELNGVGVQSTNALAIGGSSGRGADLRELPAELIKSVDVVKGSTADMTEGSIGGTVQIKTRSGLDFQRPYFSLRGGVQQNSLGKDWTPDANAVASRKFFNDRLGVIVSGTYSKLQNNGHNYENTVSSNRNFARLYDFDNSPEKTFSFNPATVGTDAADVPFANSTAPDGTTLTPREFVTLAAGVTSKAQCLTVFPNLPAPTVTQSAAQNLPRTQRILEQQSCLNQWNDAAPSLIRNFVNTQNDQRYSFDGRMDFRVTDNLVVFASGTVANRKVHDQNRSRNQLSGNAGIFNSNLNGTFVDSTTGYPLSRTVAATAPAGYSVIDPQFGLQAVNSLIGTPAVGGVRPTFGNVVNIVPGSVVVDGNHNLTQFTLTNNSVNIDQIENEIDTRTKYGQFGTEYRGERLEIDAFVGATSARTSRGDMRTNRTYAYGDATLTLQPNGLYDIDLPANYDDSNAANFVQPTAPTCIGGGTAPTCIGQNAVLANSDFSPVAIPAYTVGQLPLVTPNFGVSYSPSLGKASEKIAKFDLAYKFDDDPFIKRVKVGAQYRQNNIRTWGGGGYTASSPVGTFGTAGYVPGVYVPTANVRGQLRACQPTATSTVPCNYGFVPFIDPRAVRSGVDTLTPQELIDLFTKTTEPADSKYFGDLPNRGSLPESWNGIRTDELFDALGASKFINTDCLITCTGSDGKTYDQPVRRANETIKNVYGMIDFETPLPFGLLFNGNIGVRGVFVDVQGTGLQTITAITVTPNFNPAAPGTAGGFISRSFIQNVSVDRSTKDYLPTANINFWGFDEKLVLRFYGGKTVARPNINNLIPGGVCTIDERQILDTAGGDDIFGCSGRVGNPGLSAFKAWNYNASLEWYPNADTLFSVAYGKLDVKVGNPIAVTVNQQPFAGSDQIDPVTGQPLADFTFSVPTFANGPGYKRDILEFSAKTAFTFLPWIFRNTGFDANYSLLKSAATSGQQDPETGIVQPPPDESKHYVNASLWYDDGKFTFRVAYQRRSSRFNCITPCLGGNSVDNNYPGEQWQNVRIASAAPYLGYNPGVPRFQDGSTFIDAKMAYNITKNFQIYAEARNVTREAQTISTGDYVPFEDGTPKIFRLQYGGRRVLAGARIQFGN